MNKFDVARRFVLAFCPDYAQIELQDLLAEIKTNPVGCLNNGLLLTHLGYFKGEDRKYGNACAVGMVFGINLLHALISEEGLAPQLEDYLKLQARQRGENIVNFLDRKKV